MDVGKRMTYVMLIMLSVILLWSTTTQAQEKNDDGLWVESAGIRVHIQPEWIKNNVERTADFSALTVLFLRVWNDAQDALFISPFAGLRKVTDTREDDGAFVAGPGVVGPPRRRIEHSPMLHLLQEMKEAKEQRYTALVEQLLGSGKDDEHTAYKKYAVPAGTYRDVVAVVAANTNTVDLFTFELVVERENDNVVVDLPLKVVVMDGNIYMYIVPYDSMAQAD